MVCIYCVGKTSVANSRGSKKSPETWRRRECMECGTVFTTRERPDYEGALRIRKEDGRLQPFLRDKLFISVYNSLSHRKTAQSDATELTDTVILQLIELHTGGIASGQTLTATTLQVLNRFDKAAGVYYQAHYC